MSLRDVAAEHRALDPETREHFKILGAAATSAHRAGVIGKMKPAAKQQRRQSIEGQWWAWGEQTQLPRLLEPLSSALASCNLAAWVPTILDDGSTHAILCRLVALNSKALLQPETPYSERLLQAFAGYLQKGVEHFTKKGNGYIHTEADAQKVWEGSQALLDTHKKFQLRFPGAATYAAQTWSTMLTTCLGIDGLQDRDRLQQKSEHWEELHRGLKSGSQQKAPASATMCSRLGCCVCRGSPGHIQQVVLKRFHRHLCECYPKGLARKKLLEGEVLTVWSPVPRAHVPGAPEEPAVPLPNPVWCHISLMYFTRHVYTAEENICQYILCPGPARHAEALDCHRA